MNLMREYGLDPADLAHLQDSIRAFLSVFGVSVHEASLDRVVETDVYRVDRAMASDDAHHETCVSDGLDVWVHDEIEHAGGECSRLYDLLHVGCGHLFQWASGPESGLEFHGDRAWDMASTFYLRKPEPDILRVRAYEFEAARIANGNLPRILEAGRFPESFRDRFSAMFNDYAATDLDYITDYYRTGEVRNIFDGWKRDAARIPPIEVTAPVRPIRRNNRCVALISRRDPGSQG